MMRITPATNESEVTQVRIEGRITAQATDDLAASCAPFLEGGTMPLLVDLSDVAYADRCGVEALRQLRDQGAVLVGSSGVLQELLKEPAAEDRGGAEAPDADQKLTAALRRGDGEAFEEVVRLCGGRMLAVARRFLRSEADARDAVQDAFLSAFRGVGQFSGDSRLSTWLHRIVVNACLMKLRSRRRKPEASLDDLLPHFKEDGHWADAPSRWEATAETLFERHETRAMVRACIAELPENARTVLMLRDIEELDTEEVAGLLGITPNAVKVRLHRARQALRTLIERRLPS